jgi:glucose-6-phosphate 1-epimerase
VGLVLSISFEVVARAPLSYELALHTYLGVGDVRNVSVRGLEGASYDDKVSGERGVREGPAPLTFNAETDRVYESSGRVSVNDPLLGRQLHIDKEGSATTVVWNPWTEKAKRMADFGDDEWPAMLCVETANAGKHRVTLEAGARHVTSTTISAEDL